MGKLLRNIEAAQQREREREREREKEKNIGKY